jgi:hypothetical protein
MQTTRSILQATLPHQDIIFLPILCDVLLKEWKTSFFIKKLNVSLHMIYLVKNPIPKFTVSINSSKISYEYNIDSATYNIT